MRVRLLPGERVIVRTRPNPLPLVWPLVAGFALLAVGGFGIGYVLRRELPGVLADWQPVLLLVVIAVVLVLLLQVLVRPLVRWAGNRYVLTSMRLIHRSGVSRRTEHQINLTAISQVLLEQRLVQRMVGSGTLVVDLGFDRAHHYPDMPRIVTFKDYMMQAIAELPLTRMFDGVDMEIDPQYARDGAPRMRQGWVQQERRGEQP